jgi:hypothetical protein
MNRPYPTYSPGSRPWRTTGIDDYAETDVIEDYDDYDGYDAEDDVYEYVEPLDRRWMWVAGAAGAVLLVAVICTVVILGGGDSGSVSATVSPPSVTTSPAATSQAPSRSPSMPAPAPLPTGPLTPETVTTVAPSPSAEAAPPPEAAPAPAPSTITYQVTGSRQLIDLVTVIYTDGQGALQTELNVALPWSKSVVLDPGVTLGSVTATSVMGQLNCAITDAAGAVVAAQSNNTLIANCTK